jgi:hypothetical protein
MVLPYLITTLVITAIDPSDTLNSQKQIAPKLNSDNHHAMAENQYCGLCKIMV